MGSVTNEVFDASKQAKAPAKFYSSAPLDLPAVRIGFVSPAVGYGLFAARDLAKDEFIFHEAPLMTARFNEVFAADKALMQSQVSAYRSALAAHQAVTSLAFPALAAQFGILPAIYDDATLILSSPTEMGQNLVPGQGQFAGSSVTREQYDSYTASLKPATTTTEPDARAACLEFFKHYAFQVQPNPITTTTGATTATAAATTTTTREACVYLLASLINHCCTPSPPLPFPFSLPTITTSSSTKTHPPPAAATPVVDGPNCSWRIGPSGLAHFVRPRHICVQARRAIRAGEQLTWDYGKREKGFACECEVCRDRLLGGLGNTCGVL